MFQNHMMQMLSLVAMEPPSSFETDSLRDEKVKLLRSIRPAPLDRLDRWAVRGQYARGKIEGAEAPGYREEEGVAPDSRTETFVAAKVLVDNWRWQDVPFYLRAGKRLPRRISEIAIQFRAVPHMMFRHLLSGDLPPNELVLNIQPEEGVALTFQAKRPGPSMYMTSLTLDFHYRNVFSGALPDAYERLLMDCIAGDQALFIRQDEVMVAWGLLTPVLEAWENDKKTVPCPYPAGAWGPDESDSLIRQDGRKWRRLDVGFTPQ
jgi:glucose-6-phosphate 1-dehydrogenase